MKKVGFLLFFQLWVAWAYGQKIEITHAGDYADPSVVRVGKDYYNTHTSHAYYPDLLIWHSTDLKHWEPVTRALDTNMGTVWAPEQVYHEKKFSIYFLTDQGSVYVISADRPEGPWSKPVRIDMERIDPGFVADRDGNNYLYVNGGRVVCLSSDGLKAVSKEKKCMKGGSILRIGRSSVSAWNLLNCFFITDIIIWFRRREGLLGLRPVTYLSSRGLKIVWGLGKTVLIIRWCILSARMNRGCRKGMRRCLMMCRVIGIGYIMLLIR